HAQRSPLPAPRRRLIPPSPTDPAHEHPNHEKRPRSVLRLLITSDKHTNAREGRTILRNGRCTRPFVYASLAVALALVIPPVVLARRETGSIVRPTSTRWAGS